MNLISLQIKHNKNVRNNLKNLIRTIQELPSNSTILVNELGLSGYSYDELENSAKFSNKVIEELLKLSKDRAVALTLITKRDDKFYNSFYFFANEKILHKQDKVKLFTLGDEQKYFTSGDKQDIKLFDYNGVKIGVLICFELRFVELWQRLKGADVILIPAMWGTIREQHLKSLCKALAISNQCFVVATNSKNKEFSKGSAIISPFGEVYKKSKKGVIFKNCDFNEIKKMRKYINVGIR